MANDWKSLRPVLPILIGACVMLSLGVGMRHSMGLFMTPLTKDIGISVADFTLAIAIQNLVWGFLQPFAGAWVVRFGYRPFMVGGALLYSLGLVLMASAQGTFGVIAGGGVAVGIALAFTASAIAHSVTARSVSTPMRSIVLGITSAFGSIGSLLAAPLGQVVTDEFGWRAGVLGFALLALLMVPAAWYGGRIDKLPYPKGGTPGETNARAALKLAFGTPMFVVMTIAFFVCGMQLVFLTTHLPAYLALCGMDPMLSAQALGVIGGFNVLGSLFFGWAGGRYNKLMLLGGIYIVRSLALAWYFISAPTTGGTLVFAAIMGFLWLGVIPLMAGWLAERFSLRWQAMLSGVAFVSHQVGSFVGAYGGGLLFDLFGSYTAAWQGGVAIGLLAGIVQAVYAWERWHKPPSGAVPA